MTFQNPAGYSLTKMAFYVLCLLAGCSGQSEDSSTSTDAGTDAAQDTGTFANTVMPIFKSYCAACHSPSTSSAGLTLTGVSASTARGNLVGVQSTQVSMALVQAGSPDSSWLMHKLTGDFSGVTCTACMTTMPQTGAKPSSDDVANIRAWITAGATDQ